MKLSTIFLSAISVISTGATLFLYQQNSNLLLQNQELQQKALVQVETPEESCPKPKTVVVTKEVPAQQPTSAPTSTATTQDTPREYRPSTSFDEYVERKNKRMERIAAFLGRLEGETEEQYRARMSPLIAMGLSMPRKLLEEGKEAAFQNANVNKEQQASLDQIISSAYDEALDLTNRSITSGEVSPYERNPGALLHLAGSMGAVLDETVSKINQVLTPEQQKQLAETGFDWAEYLAVSAPWETLSPPPPPKP